MKRYLLLLLSLPGIVHAQEKFTPTGKDWVIPRAEPKPLVWRSDWTPPAKPRERTATQQEALESMHEADRLKQQEEFAQAEKAYQKAIRLDPDLAMASYQLACNYALWNKPRQAKVAFDAAIKAGFSDYGSAYDDDELGPIRHMPDFSAHMKVIRDRYIKVQATLIGQPVAFKPKGAKPAKGWPVIVMLHGKGDTNLSFFPEGEAWAELGVLPIALPGTIPAMVEGFVWDSASIEPTHQDVQACLQSKVIKDLIDPERVVLFGFSQGAIHGMGMIQQHPGKYAGLLAMSPGGSPTKPMFPGKLQDKQPRKLHFIHGKDEPHAPFAKMFQALCKTANWPYKLDVHPGGHHFPENWDDLRLASKKFFFE